MADKLIFLSHIHEEKALAALIKTALENEFSGFVEVFVSSDGVSIPAGANFLKRIEGGLIDCVGALYLISSTSVRRNWINFELGAVWVRNIMSLRIGGAEIPTIPVCHSGMTPGALPAPLNNLNAISATEASQLELAFASLQKAGGGKGRLKTDFDALAAQINLFVRGYTTGVNIARILDILKGTAEDRARLIAHCEVLPQDALERLECGFQPNAAVEALKNLEANELKGVVTVETQNSGVNFTDAGAIAGANVRVYVPAALVVEHKQLLLGRT